MEITRNQNRYLRQAEINPYEDRFRKPSIFVSKSRVLGDPFKWNPAEVSWIAGGGPYADPLAFAQGLAKAVEIATELDAANPSE
jgi:hypothetical protein